MKKFLCLLYLCSSILCASARVFTVSNLPTNPAQFSDLQTAMMRAVAADTFYVHGSYMSYGSIVVYVPVVIIGTGHNPLKQNALTTVIDDIDLSFVGNFQIIGATFRKIQGTANNSPSNEIRIRRCRIVENVGVAAISIGGTGNLIVEGNIFDGQINNISIGNDTRLICQNNILHGPIVGSPGPSTPALILNNIFLGNRLAFAGVGHAVINNNIFYGAPPYGLLDPETSTMNNNISFNAGIGFPSPGNNNLDNVDPQFVNVPDGLAFDYNYDYHLLLSSPGYLSGTDGSDRGVYGGMGFHFSMTGEPPIAEVTEFVISPPTTISINGTLFITVKSKSVK